MATTSPPGSGMRERARVRLGLRYRGHDLPLLKPEIVIGRSADCDLVLDSQLVSRRHAMIRLHARQQPSVLDLGSRNGVFVNGTLISAETLLSRGDRLSIGEEVLDVVEQQDAPERDRVTAERTPRDTIASPPPSDTEEHQYAERTRKADAFVLLGGVVDKALALGRGDEAERLLGGHLAGVLGEAQRGVALERGVAAVAARYAAKLAAATGKPSWVDYPIHLYRALGEPLPLPVVDELYGLLRRVRGVDRAALRQYLAVLHLHAGEMSAADRFVLQRIEGLERLAGL